MIYEHEFLIRQGVEVFHLASKEILHHMDLKVVFLIMIHTHQYFSMCKYFKLLILVMELNQGKMFYESLPVGSENGHLD